MAVYLSDESGQLHKVAGNGPNVAPLIKNKVDMITTSQDYTTIINPTGTSIKLKVSENDTFDPKETYGEVNVWSDQVDFGISVEGNLSTGASGMFNKTYALVMFNGNGLEAVDDHVELFANFANLKLYEAGQYDEPRLELNDKPIALKEQIPTTTSSLTNDSDFITSASVNTKLADLKKEILTGGANEEVNTAYDTLLEISKWIQSNKVDTSLTEEIAKLQNNKLAKGNDTLTGSITLTGDGKLVLSPSGKGQLTDGTSSVLGFNNATQLDVGNKTYNLALLGKATRPSYNGNDLALKSDIITSYNSLTDKPSIGNGLITIKQGTVSKSFNLNSNDALTIELTDNNTTYTAGNGLTLTGTSFAVKAGSNITVDTNGVSVTSGAFVTPSSLTTTLGSYVTTSNLNTTLSGYSTTGHKHTTSDITNFGTYVNQTTGTSAVKGK